MKVLKWWGNYQIYVDVPLGDIILEAVLEKDEFTDKDITELAEKCDLSEEAIRNMVGAYNTGNFLYN